MSQTYQQQLEAARQNWNTAAPTFDQEPDHGLQDPVALAAWTALLQGALPSHSVNLLDIGCGTGTLSLLFAGLGCTVTGIDFSPKMLEQATAKAKKAGLAIHFQMMDAAFPTLPPQQFEVVVCRHVLWALPAPDQVLHRWVQLLKPGGCLLLIEGFWHTGAGLHAQQIVDVLPAGLTQVTIQPLSTQAALWGGEVSDERYLIRAELQA